MAKANLVPEVYWAIENEQHATLGRLFEHGVEVNVPKDDDYILRLREIFDTMGNPCMKAYEVTEKLDLEARVSPLGWAASLGRDSMLEYLLDHDADIEQRSSGLCTCSDDLLCCPRGLPQTPEFRMVDRHQDWDFVWWTPLHYAICNRKASTAQLLLERGASAFNLADIDDDNHQVTALHVATRWRSYDTINYLLDKDLFDINAQNIFGVTVLHLAHLACEYHLVDKFLDKGADINLDFYKETGPWTVFSLACADLQFDRALQYLWRGADPHFVLEDPDGDEFTVMRLIYYGVFDLAAEDRAERMVLEQEIIAGGRWSPSDT